MTKSIITYNQKKKIVKHFQEDGKTKTIVINIRYDDECRNGHNSFAITGTILRGKFETEKGVHDRYWEACGCIHDEIAKHAPELKHLIKWHHMNSDGPMHYISNTMYHARDTDCDGLKKGEYGAYKMHVINNDISTKQTVTLYKTGEMYSYKPISKNLEKSNKAEQEMLDDFVNSLTVSCNIIKINCGWSKSEGKGIDLEAARNCAIWSDATLEQLSDKAQLEARLPALIEEFKQVIKELGFTF